jgi:cbb3-type cytochrome oxidase maturation protein
MDVLFLLIPCSALAALTFLAAFFWAVQTGQYDDNFTPSVRILLDDGRPEEIGEMPDISA